MFHLRSRYHVVVISFTVFFLISLACTISSPFVTPTPVATQTPSATATLTSTPTPVPTFTPTPALPGILAAVKSVAHGQGIPEAAEYNPDHLDLQHLVVLNASGMPHPSNNSLPSAWLPASVSDIEMVVVVGNEREVEMDSLSYIGGPPITRYRFERDVAIRDAHTGAVLWETTIEGAGPGPFPKVAPVNQTRLDGEHVSDAFMSSWLVSWLTCKVGDGCRLLPGAGFLLPDGQTMLLRNDRKLELRQVSDRKLIHRFESKEMDRAFGVFVEISPDGQVVVVGVCTQKL